MARNCPPNKMGKYCVSCKSTQHNSIECKFNDRPQSHVSKRAAVVQYQEDPDDIKSVQINGKKYVEIGFCKTANPTKDRSRVYDGVINGESARVLRDTGCNTVLVRQGFVKPHQYTGASGFCFLADGTARQMKIVEIDIDTPFYKGKVSAMVSGDS